MKHTYSCDDWQRELDELKSASNKKNPEYGFDGKGAPIFYAYCRQMSVLARIDGEYEIADEIEALPIRHARLFG